MPTISQILAVSYPAVLNDRKKPANQWAESAFLRELEKKGAVERKSLGPTIEHTLDYQRNPGASFLTTDLQPISMTKTEVLTAAEYTPGQIVVPVTWSKGDEAKNPTENQKVDLVASLLDNAFETHDDMIEEALFSTSTNNFLGLQTLVPDNGQGSPGGINAAADAWWRNYSSTYLDDGTNIRAAMTAAWNAAAKGTGGAAPDIIVSDADAQAIYEATLQEQQRYLDSKEANGGFKVLAFKTARYVFSQHGNTRIYFLNSKFIRVRASKDAYQQKGETIEIPNAAGYICQLYSMMQFTTNNKSRLSVLTQTS